jgi:predicted 3-demethylubiquinone-9 3-methyltransferase (glyoxalase superfamily)
MVVTFELNGTKFMGLNGGPQFTFDEAISLVVNCDSQQEIDYYWEKLTADGGKESMCGWLKDKYGLSWQIVPSNIGELMMNPEKSQRVMDVVMKMKKLDMEKMTNA